MPDTWKDTTFWKPKITLFAVILICSLGLCGVNYAGASALPNGGTLLSILMATGFIEILGMIIGALGLFVCLTGLAVASLLGSSRSDDPTIHAHPQDREDDR